MTVAGTPQIIGTKLHLHLRPAHLEIVDESNLHEGHAGARSGGGHYRVTIVSESFEGLTAPQRHRLVYRVLDTEMHGVIHALSLSTLTPAEWASAITDPS